MKIKMLILFTVLFTIISCNNDDDAVTNAPTLTTFAITDITSISATSGGNITDDGGSAITSRGVCYSTNPSPTVADNTTNDGIGIGDFTSSLTSLIGNTTYYVKAYATNSHGIASYGNEQTFTTASSTGAVTDIDGNTYQTVVIGTQEWMAEDLRVTHYPNGDAIPYITGDTTWDALPDNNTDDAYSFYNNDNTTDYGALYSYASAIADNWTKDNTANQGVCPDGWHLPSDDEWMTLTSFLGSAAEAGGKMKETGITHWNSPNLGATNSSGFTALAGGCRTAVNGAFINKGYSNTWWSSTEDGVFWAFGRHLRYNTFSVESYNYNKSQGFCVRCIRD